MKPAGKFIIFIPLWERMPRSLPTAGSPRYNRKMPFIRWHFRRIVFWCAGRNSILWDTFFEDDRLYFCVIPLLQEKLAQVQMKVRKVQVLRKNHPYKVKVDIDLYFRAEKEIMTYKGRDRNFEIAKILNDYEADLTGKMRKSWE